MKAYQERFKDYPRQGSIIGYSAIMSLAAGIKKAQSTDTEKLITAFSGLTLSSPVGPITYRAQDHQSTMGSYVGRTKNEGGKGVMVDFRYMDGAKFLPTDAQVQAWRAKD